MFVCLFSSDCYCSLNFVKITEKNVVSCLLEFILKKIYSSCFKDYTEDESMCTQQIEGIKW